MGWSTPGALVGVTGSAVSVGMAWPSSEEAGGSAVRVGMACPSDAALAGSGATAEGVAAGELITARVELLSIRTVDESVGNGWAGAELMTAKVELLNIKTVDDWEDKMGAIALAEM